MGMLLQLVHPSWVVLHLGFALLLKARQRGISILLLLMRSLCWTSSCCAWRSQTPVPGALYSQNQEQARTPQALCKNLSMEGWPAAAQKQPLGTVGCTMQTESAPNVCWGTLWIGASPYHCGWRQEWVRENQRYCPALLHTDNFVLFMKFHNPALGAKEGRQE